MSSKEYNFCGNAIKGLNFTTLIGSLPSLLHYSDWGGAFVPDSLRCGRNPTSASLEQCTAPMNLPVFNRDFLRNSKYPLNPTNEYEGHLCEQNLPRNPVLVGNSDLTGCTLEGHDPALVYPNDPSLSNYRHGKKEGLQIGFIVSKDLKFVVHKVSILGFWFNVTTPGPLEDFGSVADAKRIDLEVSNCESEDAFLSFNMNGNWAKGSFFNFVSNKIHWFEDYRYARQREGIQTDSMFSMILFPPPSTCDGCGIRIASNDFHFQGGLYIPGGSYETIDRSFSMVQLISKSMKDACVTVTNTKFRLSYRGICWYASDKPVVMAPLQESKYKVPIFNLLGNKRLRLVVIKVHTGSQVTIKDTEYLGTTTETKSYHDKKDYPDPWKKLGDPVAFTISGDSGPFTFEKVTVKKSYHMIEFLDEYGENIPTSNRVIIRDTKFIPANDMGYFRTSVPSASADTSTLFLEGFYRRSNFQPSLTGNYLQIASSVNSAGFASKLEDVDLDTPDKLNKYCTWYGYKPTSLGDRSLSATSPWAICSSVQATPTTTTTKATTRTTTTTTTTTRAPTTPTTKATTKATTTTTTTKKPTTTTVKPLSPPIHL